MRTRSLIKSIWPRQVIQRASVVVLAAALGTACAGSGRTVLVSKAMRFDRSELRVKAGQTVLLELHNADAYAHAFDVDPLDIHVALPGSASVSIAFTPTVPAEYVFYCGAPGHRSAGMTGRLIVEP
jgi:uncharacterized cupredoxin-like copper-binding protein